MRLNRLRGHGGRWCLPRLPGAARTHRMQRLMEHAQGASCGGARAPPDPTPSPLPDTHSGAELASPLATQTPADPAAFANHPGGCAGSGTRNRDDDPERVPEEGGLRPPDVDNGRCTPSELQDEQGGCSTSHRTRLKTITDRAAPAFDGTTPLASFLPWDQLQAHYKQIEGARPCPAHRERGERRHQTGAGLHLVEEPRQRRRCCWASWRWSAASRRREAMSGRASNVSEDRAVARGRSMPAQPLADRICVDEMTTSSQGGCTTHLGPHGQVLRVTSFVRRPSTLATLGGAPASQSATSSTSA